MAKTAELEKTGVPFDEVKEKAEDIAPNWKRTVHIRPASFQHKGPYRFAVPTDFDKRLPIIHKDPFFKFVKPYLEERAKVLGLPSWVEFIDGFKNPLTNKTVSPYYVEVTEHGSDFNLDIPDDRLKYIILRNLSQVCYNDEPKSFHWLVMNDVALMADKKVSKFKRESNLIIEATSKSLQWKRNFIRIFAISSFTLSEEMIDLELCNLIKNDKLIDRVEEKMKYHNLDVEMEIFEMLEFKVLHYDSAKNICYGDAYRWLSLEQVIKFFTDGNNEQVTNQLRIFLDDNKQRK